MGNFEMTRKLGNVLIKEKKDNCEVSVSVIEMRGNDLINEKNFGIEVRVKYGIGMKSEILRVRIEQSVEVFQFESLLIKKW
jgi:hypothetical protein